MAATVRFDTWENSTSSKSVTIDQIAGGSGLVAIIPASTAVGSGSASVSAGGVVTFTGSTSISLNGVFNGTYSTYKIVFKITGASATSAGINFRLRSAGVDNTTSSYQRSAFLVKTNGTSVVGSGTDTVLACVDTTSLYPLGYVNMEIKNAAVAITKEVLFQSNGIDSANVAYSFTGSSSITIASVMDGFTFSANSGNISGTIQVYGYR